MSTKSSYSAVQLSSHSDTQLPPVPEDDSLELKTSQSETILLTTSQLTKFFAYLEKTNRLDNQQDANDTYLATQFLGRFGLKSPKDVMAFLKSPAGESILEMVGEQLAEIASIQDFEHLEYQTEQVRKHRFIAFLLMGLLYKSAHAKHINELIQQQIDQKLHKSPQTTESTTKSAQHEVVDSLKHSVEAYQEGIQAMETQLEQTLNKADVLDKEMFAIEDQAAIIKRRYNTFDNHLEQVDEYLELPASQDNPSTTTSQESITIIRNRIDQLTEQLEKQLDDITGALEEGRDEEAMALMHEHNGLHLQIAGLNDKLAVINNDKVLLNEHAEEVKSFKEAHFIMPKNQAKQLVRVGEAYFLLTADQLENRNQLSQDEWKKAGEHFQKSKPEINNLKVLVRDNRTQEQRFNGERKKSADIRSDQLQKDILLLSSQLNQMQDAQANITARMQQSDPSANQTPQPLPKPTPLTKTAGTTKTTMPKPSNSYRRVFELLIHNPTPESIDRLKNAVRAGAAPSQSQEMDKVFNQVKAGLPMTEAKRKNLLQQFDRLGVDRKRASVLVPPTSTIPLAPTPLSMRPGGR